MHWYLLTMIPSVNAGHIKRLYQDGLCNFNIPLDWHFKPEIPLNQGSPNTARVTKEFFKDIGADLSYARVRRPTDRQCFDRTILSNHQAGRNLLVGDYQDEETAKEVIGEYIEWYNEKRPHQALWNFIPHMVHEMNNKTSVTTLNPSFSADGTYTLEMKNLSPHKYAVRAEVIVNDSVVLKPQDFCAAPPPPKSDKSKWSGNEDDDDKNEDNMKRCTPKKEVYAIVNMKKENKIKVKIYGPKSSVFQLSLVNKR